MHCLRINRLLISLMLQILNEKISRQYLIFKVPISNVRYFLCDINRNQTMLVNQVYQGFIFIFSFLLTRQKFAVVMSLCDLTVSLNSVSFRGISTMNKGLL